MSLKEEVCFLFSGQGGQYPKTGLHLYNQSQLFRTIIEELSLDFEKQFDSHLYDYLFGSKSDLITTVEYSAPLIYSLQVALVAYLRRSQIYPTVVCGSSMGEYAAAYSCEMIDYSTGLYALRLRNRLINQRVQGDMLFIQDSENVVKNYLTNSSVIALKNSPRATVVSDSKENLQLLFAKLRKDKIKSFPLNCSVPFHSPLMTPIVEDYKFHLDGLNFKPSNHVVFYSSILDLPLKEVSADYWIKNTLEPVDLLSSFRNIENKFKPLKIIEISGNNGLLTFYSDSNINVDHSRQFFFFKRDESDLQTIKKLLSEI